MLSHLSSCACVSHWANHARLACPCGPCTNREIVRLCTAEVGLARTQHAIPPLHYSLVYQLWVVSMTLSIAHSW